MPMVPRICCQCGTEFIDSAYATVKSHWKLVDAPCGCNDGNRRQFQLCHLTLKVHRHVAGYLVVIHQHSDKTLIRHSKSYSFNTRRSFGYRRRRNRSSNHGLYKDRTRTNELCEVCEIPEEAGGVVGTCGNINVHNCLLQVSAVVVVHRRELERATFHVQQKVPVDPGRHPCIEIGNNSRAPDGTVLERKAWQGRSKRTVSGPVGAVAHSAGLTAVGVVAVISVTDLGHENLFVTIKNAQFLHSGVILADFGAVELAVVAVEGDVVHVTGRLGVCHYLWNSLPSRSAGCLATVGQFSARAQT
mmetsp:Transcript_5684/g.10849  ORF Transcript_5684/g.10849 Transcript_5684/m.10849 type:complete len:302 (-) Transcript_5684:772-1677(-)